MRPLRRGYVNKSRSAGQFRRHSRHTKGANVQVMRGGIRF